MRLTSSAINIEDFKRVWHLFELKIVVEEPNDQNRPSKSNLQPTKSNQLNSAMAPKMRGSINEATKSKAQVVAEAKKKATEEEKKMYALQQHLHKIRKAKLDEHNWSK